MPPYQMKLSLLAPQWGQFPCLWAWMSASAASVRRTDICNSCKGSEGLSGQTLTQVWTWHRSAVWGHLGAFKAVPQGWQSAQDACQPQGRPIPSGATEGERLHAQHWEAIQTYVRSEGVSARLRGGSGPEKSGPARQNMQDQDRMDSSVYKNCTHADQDRMDSSVYKNCTHVRHEIRWPGMTAVSCSTWLRSRLCSAALWPPSVYDEVTRSEALTRSTL
jgi:hypothetical protein